MPSDSTKLPLNKRTFYIDDTDLSSVDHRKLVRLLKSCGGKVEELLTAEISYLITSHGTSEDYSRRRIKSPGSAGSPAMSASPFVNTPQSVTTPPAAMESDVGKHSTRASMILAKSRKSNGGKSSLGGNLLTRARNCNVPFLHPDAAFAWLIRKMAILSPPKVKKSPRKKAKKSLLSRSRKLKGNFLKLEHLTKRKKPIFKEFSSQQVYRFDNSAHYDVVALFTNANKLSQNFKAQKKLEKEVTQTVNKSLSTRAERKQSKPKLSEVKRRKANMTFCFMCDKSFSNWDQHLECKDHKSQAEHRAFQELRALGDSMLTSTLLEIKAHNQETNNNREPNPGIDKSHSGTQQTTLSDKPDFSVSTPCKTQTKDQFTPLKKILDKTLNTHIIARPTRSRPTPHSRGTGRCPSPEAPSPSTQDVYRSTLFQSPTTQILTTTKSKRKQQLVTRDVWLSPRLQSPTTESQETLKIARKFCAASTETPVTPIAPSESIRVTSETPVTPIAASESTRVTSETLGTPDRSPRSPKIRFLLTQEARRSSGLQSPITPKDTMKMSSIQPCSVRIQRSLPIVQTPDDSDPLPASSPPSKAVMNTSPTLTCRQPPSIDQSIRVPSPSTAQSQCIDQNQSARTSKRSVTIQSSGIRSPSVNRSPRVQSPRTPRSSRLRSPTIPRTPQTASSRLTQHSPRTYPIIHSPKTSQPTSSTGVNNYCLPDHDGQMVPAPVQPDSPPHFENTINSLTPPLRVQSATDEMPFLSGLLSRASARFNSPFGFGSPDRLKSCEDFIEKHVIQAQERNFRRSPRLHPQHSTTSDLDTSRASTSSHVKNLFSQPQYTSAIEEVDTPHSGSTNQHPNISILSLFQMNAYNAEVYQANTSLSSTPCTSTKDIEPETLLSPDTRSKNRHDKIPLAGGKENVPMDIYSPTKFSNTKSTCHKRRAYDSPNKHNSCRTPRTKRSIVKQSIPGVVSMDLLNEHLALTSSVNNVNDDSCSVYSVISSTPTSVRLHREQLADYDAETSTMDAREDSVPITSTTLKSKPKSQQSRPLRNAKRKLSTCHDSDGSASGEDSNDRLSNVNIIKLCNELKHDATPTRSHQTTECYVSIKDIMNREIRSTDAISRLGEMTIEAADASLETAGASLETAGASNSRLLKLNRSHSLNSSAAECRRVRVLNQSCCSVRNYRCDITSPRLNRADINSRLPLEKVSRTPLYAKKFIYRSKHRDVTALYSC